MATFARLAKFLVNLVDIANLFFLWYSPVPMSSFNLQTAYGKALAGVVVAIVAVLAYDTFLQGDQEARFKPKENQPCEGKALPVDYPYHGGMLTPHACAPQCEDKAQRYILYTNGKATQCQTVPGCLDWGEDQGVTCIPPKAE